MGEGVGASRQRRARVAHYPATRRRHTRTIHCAYEQDIAKLYDREIISWKQRTLTVLNEKELANIARFEREVLQLRPLI